jgi:hypothetical protein
MTFPSTSVICKFSADPPSIFASSLPATSMQSTLPLEWFLPLSTPAEGDNLGLDVDGDEALTLLLLCWVADAAAVTWIEVIAAAKTADKTTDQGSISCCCCWAGLTESA